MERLATLFTGSFRQLRRVKTVTVSAMLGAIVHCIRLLSIELGSTLRIWFFQVFQMRSSICFSDRLWEVFLQALMDILKYLIKPYRSIFFLDLR